MWTKEDYEIKNQINLILTKLGASEDILSVIGSWKDTMDDDFILSCLININKDQSIWKNKVASQKRINPNEN